MEGLLWNCLVFRSLTIPRILGFHVCVIKWEKPEGQTEWEGKAWFIFGWALMSWTDNVRSTSSLSVALWACRSTIFSVHKTCIHPTKCNSGSREKEVRGPGISQGTWQEFKKQKKKNTLFLYFFWHGGNHVSAASHWALYPVVDSLKLPSGPWGRKENTKPVETDKNEYERCKGSLTAVCCRLLLAYHNRMKVVCFNASVWIAPPKR